MGHSDVNHMLRPSRSPDLGSIEGEQAKHQMREHVFERQPSTGFQAPKQAVETSFLMGTENECFYAIVYCYISSDDG